MPCRNCKPVALLVALASSLSCTEPSLEHGRGRLELVIRPDQGAPSYQPLHGSFLLHGLDQPTRVYIPVDAHGDLTRGVSLVPGAYALQWQPELDAEALGAHPAVEDLQRAVPTEPRVLLLVTAGAVTTVNVRTALDDGHAQRLVASGAVPPEPERLALH